jgi:hypothetical protein
MFFAGASFDTDADGAMVAGIHAGIGGGVGNARVGGQWSSEGGFSASAGGSVGLAGGLSAGGQVGYNITHGKWGAGAGLSYSGDTSGVSGSRPMGMDSWRVKSDVSLIGVSAVFDVNVGKAVYMELSFSAGGTDYSYDVRHYEGRGVDLWSTGFELGLSVGKDTSTGSTGRATTGSGVVTTN